MNNGSAIALTPPSERSSDRKGILHFVNRIDDTNAGDRVASPLLHYLDYFGAFHLKRHDIRYIEVESILPQDVVIFGGGGIFDYAEFMNRAINRVLRSGAAVIGWSPGFNTHRAYPTPYRTEIDFTSFDLLTVRDFGNPHGLPYLSDVTCKLPQLTERHEVRRDVGIARHKDFPVPVSGLDEITNEGSIDEILTFIGESDVILSNSYHMIYWATLMGKRCISPDGFSTRFDGFKYPPTFFRPEDESIHDAIARSRSYDVREECITENDAFFADVRRIVEHRVEPSRGSVPVYTAVTEAAQAHQRARESELRPGDMVGSRLLIDTGRGFRLEDSLTAINNVYGDDVLRVEFDLTGFETVERVAFQPINGRWCKSSIMSATAGSSPVDLVAQTSLRADGLDVFLTTDPFYLSASPVATSITVEFRLELLSKLEAERCSAERESTIQRQAAEHDRLVRDLEAAQLQSSAAESRAAAAESRANELETTAAGLLGSASWRVTAPLRALARWARTLRR